MYKCRLIKKLNMILKKYIRKTKRNEKKKVLAKKKRY